MVGNKFGIGILGCGGRGIYFGELFQAEPDCQLVGLCDLRPDKIEEARQVLGNLPAATSVSEFLKLPGLDTVVICTPDYAHGQNAIDALNAKKNVYLEKPMAQTIEECDRMIELWKTAGTVFFVGLELRYCSLAEDMKRLIEQGEIGDIKIGIVLDNVSVGGDYFYHGVSKTKAYTKSLMLQKGTHSIDLANWFVNASPEKVYSSSGLDFYGGNEPNDKRCTECEKGSSCPFYVDEHGFHMDYGALNVQNGCVFAEEVDLHDNGLILIDYDNGARVSFMECHFTPEYSREFIFIGTKGKMTGFYNNAQEFKITVWKRHTRKWDVYFPERRPGGHGGGDAGIMREFVARLKAGIPAAVGIGGARDSAAIAMAAFESSETGMPVHIPRKPFADIIGI